MNRFSCLTVALVMGVMLPAQLRPVPGSQPVRPVFQASDVVCSGRVESLRVLGGGVQSGEWHFAFEAGLGVGLRAGCL